MDPQSNVEASQASPDSRHPTFLRKAATSPSVVSYQQSQPAHKASQPDQIATAQPRGRLAAAMNTMEATESNSSSSDEEPIGAYARIKRQLMTEQTGDRARTASSMDKPLLLDQLDASDAGDEEEAPTKPRRKRLSQRRANLSISPRPERSVASPSSPGLFVSPHRAIKSSMSATHDRRSASLSPVSASESEISVRSLKRKPQARRLAQEVADGDTSSPEGRSADQPDVMGDAESDGSNSATSSVRARLTQETRPTRRAGKKAMAEMQRETQRLSRNTLHQYNEKTKKRFSTKDLFQRFNFKPSTPADPMVLTSTTSVAAQSKGESQRPESETNLGSSDVDTALAEGVETPPTSPTSTDDTMRPSNKAPAEATASALTDNVVDDELPSIEDMFTQRTARSDKGKGRALIDEQVGNEAGRVIRSFRIKVPHASGPGQHISLDSDEERSPAPKNRLAVFDRIAPKQIQQPGSLRAQHPLEHGPSPVRSSARKVNPNKAASIAGLQSRLRFKAHQQALEAKQEHIATLRARGIYVESAEEKQEREEFVADALHKARQEAQMIADQEREERKQNGGHDDIDMLSSEEDEDYEDHTQSEGEGVGGEVSDDLEQEPLELSGSSEEEDPDHEVEDNDQPDHAQHLAEDNTVGEDQSKAPAEAADHTRLESSADEDDQHIVPRRPANRRRNVLVVDEADAASSSAESSHDEALHAFGFKKTVKSPVTMTQMFAGTMADLDSQSQVTPFTGCNTKPAEDSLSFLRDLPPTDLPDFNAAMPDSQADESQDYTALQTYGTFLSPAVALGATQSQQRSILDTPSRSSELPDPTQDEGFLMSQSRPAIPHSTTETVVLGLQESPVMRRKGRLVRRQHAEGEDANAQDRHPSGGSGSNATDHPIEPLVLSKTDPDNAFQKMRKAAKNRSVAFDKQKSGAKEMMDEQAEESEDEYAGIGGVSEDEAGEEDEEDRAMIDNANVKVDERKIAALHAEQARIENERRVNQLYNDITTGAFRRRRGGELELSDDEDDVAAERRRRKQREFARRTKALLADEKIGALAEHTKKQAFLTAIADRDDLEDAFDFLDEPEENIADAPEDSQAVVEQPNAEQVTTIPSSILPSTAPAKRKMLDMSDRRTNLSKRPRTELELKKTISDLIEEPHFIPDSQYSEDEELEAPNSHNGHANSLPNGRADGLPTESRPVTDRLALAVMSNASVNASNATLAYQTTDNPAGLFKVPSLLRRSTTNLSAASSSSSKSISTTTTPAGVELGGATKRGGSKKSNIHYQAREAERRRAVEESERRRKDGVRKKVVGRASAGSVLGKMGNVSRHGFE